MKEGKKFKGGLNSSTAQTERPDISPPAAQESVTTETQTSLLIRYDLLGNSPHPLMVVTGPNVTFDKPLIVGKRHGLRLFREGYKVLTIEEYTSMVEIKKATTLNRALLSCICQGFYKPNHCPVHKGKNEV